MKKLKKQATIVISDDCKIESLEKQTGSYVIKATFKTNNNLTHTIFCPEQFEKELASIKELDSSCKLVFKTFKRHTPYLISLEVNK